jgi:hypothetical protein
VVSVIEADKVVPEIVNQISPWRRLRRKFNKQLSD